MRTRLHRTLLAVAALAWACAELPSSELDVTADPGLVDLGTSRQGGTVDVRLSNLGTETAWVTGAELTGAMAGFAGIAELDLPLTLEPGDSQVVTVRLTELPTIDTEELGMVLELAVTGGSAPSSGCGSDVALQESVLTIPVYVVGDARCDVDGDGYYDVACGGLDCDDTRASVSPDGVERCNGLDDNCSGGIDEDPIDGDVYYADVDGDGFGVDDVTVLSCNSLRGYADRAGDCAAEDGSIFPGADELCDGIDQDCNGVLDDNPIEGTVYYLDRDADGYGDIDTARLACTQASNRVDNALDCNDRRSGVSPDGIERCNGLDNDCNGIVDDNAVDALPFYTDADGDGVGSGAPFLMDCALPDGLAATNGDCNDANPAALPGAAEVCDGIDNDCNGQIDETGDLLWYRDVDGDGVGAGEPIASCFQPVGHVSIGGDCDAGDASIYPGAPELCDGRDHDCDGLIDEGTVWYADRDGDGFGNADVSRTTCEQPPNTVTNDLDCDDRDADVTPLATETCNGVDDNCDGLIDDDDVCPCPVETYGDRAFAFCTQADIGLSLPWNLARQACEGAGYELARIATDDENDFVAQTAQSYAGGPWWIGANDRRNEGRFRWTDGRPTLYTNWDPGEPNNAGQGEDCVELRGSGGWNDMSCFASRPFVCSTD